ncbi:GNAT family N-acetyltransferase [Streptomyces sp. RB6PN25]|uniref:GNAT family N-acetyltransferase n=1 Tax=Streptomyces humicola TaxID=2953240 RepID=A0ABT1PSE0_9ACTN|nr:GNAT family N-acetyltransferase [Streptomyces humicola]MCQ4080033.1 GNAT family N-acetyltransferase [Streptomyces humicola]
MDTTQLTVGNASLEEWRQVEQWAAEEGWNPGHGDVACFHPTDPAGFFLGRLDTRPVSAVSIVTYSEHYAFLGYYLVHPDHRRRGLGPATWQAAMPHAGGRTIGLDAVPAQQGTYQRAGFTAAHHALRHCGRPRWSTSMASGIVPVTADVLNAVADYDRKCFPADRSGFLARWTTAADRVAYVRLRDADVVGYGVIRPALHSWRIGPLFADTPDDAEALFDSLTATLGSDEEVCIDIPEPHHAACSLATSRGLMPRSHTVRMYAGPVPPSRMERTYGVTSLELG